MLDIKIVGGRAADIRNRQLKDVEIGIKDGRIAQIGKDLPEAAQTIDAKGQVIAPGFIDIHMHEEEFALCGDGWDIAECMLLMGVTTAVGGNCGSNRQWPALMEERIARQGSPINYMLFIGHNFLRDQVGNTDTRAASTPEQIERMARMVKDAVDEGAVGVSYGIEYAKGMTYEEELGVCKYILGRDDLLLSAHYRLDGDGALPSIDEMAGLCRDTGIPFQISHLSSCSAYGNMQDALDLIQRYRDSGLDVLADSYPYAAFSTSIGSDVFVPGCLERLGATYSDVELTDAPYEHVRCTKEIFEDARKNYPEMYAVAHVMREDEIAMALAHPLVMVASDGLYRGHKGHPRGAGTFPRFLGKYVREEKLCDFFTGLEKITSMPAKRLRLDGRKGYLEEGYDADITIFDPERIIDRATFTEPQLKPEGIGWVILNGQIAAKGQTIVNGSCGKYVRRP
ncbi:MAG: amidohydrolase family protein [Clostridia bacterium]|nr:amidohydrolase family protein [Clostridia bacterium]